MEEEQRARRAHPSPFGGSSGGRAPRLKGAKRPVAKGEKRVKVTLACEQCKRRNYITMKNKQNDRERMELKKYCRWDRTHTVHRETR